MTVGKSNGPLGAGATDSCEPSRMGAGNLMWVHCKNIIYS